MVLTDVIPDVAQQSLSVVTTRKQLQKHTGEEEYRDKTLILCQNEILYRKTAEGYAQVSGKIDTPQSHVRSYSFSFVLRLEEIRKCNPNKTEFQKSCNVLVLGILPN
ncbi:hypothetical protein ILYODFUR_026639 [Ilyodon furcidens]|uniref:Uncharacterized protein n=1 Tax=Ilyodon furcidens TaxID=33524 RepID=A0ABV0T0N1_9TELE